MKKDKWVCLILFVYSTIFSTTLIASSPHYKNGLVVTAHHLASEVGLDILKKGGNAIDATVAVSFALAVVFPEAGNIGGGGFLVMRTKDDLTTTIDFREKAPKASSRDMYLDEEGEVITGLSTVGALSVGVPGSVAGMLYALEKYGTMSREEVIGPAITLAEEGYRLKVFLGGKRFKRYASTDAIFNKADGSRYQPGDLFVQQDLANALKRIVDQGRDGFYKGITAELIVETMKKERGIITLEDLEDYQVVERAAVRGSYRGYDIISMGPPSSGGTCLIALLNMLERYDLKKMGWQTAEMVHLVTEAERRIYADRAEYMGCTDFVEVPLDTLLSKRYAYHRANDIDLLTATPSKDVSHGDLKKVPKESPETTHYSIIDKEGTAVSVTTTINGAFGSYLVVEGAGFLLNNEMDDFSIKPGTPNLYGLLGNEANAIEPEKRMLSSMSPTIVTKDGKNVMVIGTPGGSTIITTVLQTILNVVDYGMNMQEAVTAPRFHHQWYPDKIQYEKEKPLKKEVMTNLEKRGHTLLPRKNIGDAHGILIDVENGEFSAGADPRGKTSSAMGY